MKHNSTLVVINALALSIFSCGEKPESESSPKRFSLEITDSVQVDYLGD